MIFSLALVRPFGYHNQANNSVTPVWLLSFAKASYRE